MYQKEIRKLQDLIKKDYTTRSQKANKKGEEVREFDLTQEKTMSALQATWIRFFQTREQEEKSIKSKKTNAKKMYMTVFKSSQKNIDEIQKKLQTQQVKISKQIIDPYNQDELLSQSIDLLHQDHDKLHDAYLMLATHNWTTGIQEELSLCHQVWLLDQRIKYLDEEMSALRGQILNKKLMNRVRNSIADMIKLYENKVDQYKVYAKEHLTPVLKQLRSYNTELQEKIKMLEYTIKEQEKLLKQDKDELRDSILFKRLSTLKRT